MRRGKCCGAPKPGERAAALSLPPAFMWSPHRHQPTTSRNARIPRVDPQDNLTLIFDTIATSLFPDASSTGGRAGVEARKWRCRHCPYDDDGTAGAAAQALAQFMDCMHTGAPSFLSAPFALSPPIPVACVLCPCGLERAPRRLPLFIPSLRLAHKLAAIPEAVIVSFLHCPRCAPKPPTPDGGPLGGGGAGAEHMDTTRCVADAAVAGDASGDGSGNWAEDHEEVRRHTDERLSKRHLHLDPGGYFLVRVNRATATVEATHHPCAVDDTTGLVVDAAGKPVAAKGRLTEEQVRAHPGSAGGQALPNDNYQHGDSLFGVNNCLQPTASHDISRSTPATCVDHTGT